MPEYLGCCHGPTEAPGRYAHWARTQLHRECLREVSRCRHAALGSMLLRPTETHASDPEPEQCHMMDDSLNNDPGVSNRPITPGTPMMHEGRAGEDPAAAPKCSYWARNRFAFCL